MIIKLNPESGDDQFRGIVGPDLIGWHVKVTDLEGSTFEGYVGLSFPENDADPVTLTLHDDFDEIVVGHALDSIAEIEVS